MDFEFTDYIDDYNIFRCIKLNDPPDPRKEKIARMSAQLAKLTASLAEDGIGIESQKPANIMGE